MNDPQLTQLQDNQRLIAGYALSTGVLGLVPLPVAPDAAIARLRTRLLDEIARRRRVVLPPQLGQAICGLEQASMGRLALTSAMTFSLRYSWRWLARSFLLFLRIEDAGATLWLGTAFDWYCLRYHQGGPVTAAQAAALREAIDAATGTALRQTFTALFQRSLRRAAELGAELPQLLRELRGDTAASPPSADPLQPQEQPSGLWGKAVRLAEQELKQTERTALQACCAAFDASWARTTSQVSIQPVPGHPADTIA